MKPILFVFFLVSVLSGGLNTISRLNEYAKTAASAYANQDYMEAIASYEYLLHDLEVKDDQLQLNLAHSYFKAGLLPQASEEYRLLSDHPSQHLKAVANLQLGNIATQQKKYRQALTLYKKALVAEPLNDAARYNFELIKKYLALYPETPEENLPAPAENNAEPDSLTPPPSAEEELEPQPKKNPNANGDTEEEVEQPQPDESGQQSQNSGNSSRNEGAGNQEREQISGSAPGDSEGVNPDGQAGADQLPRNYTAEGASEEDQRAQTRRARLQQVNMSPEKARLLLEAMRSAELQYIQQLPKKSTKTPDRSKPNW